MFKHLHFKFQISKFKPDCLRHKKAPPQKLTFCNYALIRRIRRDNENEKMESRSISSINIE